jgi:hypothetical protein
MFTDSLALLSQVASEQDDIPEAKLYVSLPLALVGELDAARSLAEECLSKLKSPVTKAQFVVHLTALRDTFPKEVEFANFSCAINAF